MVLSNKFVNCSQLGLSFEKMWVSNHEVIYYENTMITATAPQDQTATYFIPNNKQPCPKCGFLIGALAVSVEAICNNCGFKDPCCE